MTLDEFKKIASAYDGSVLLTLKRGQPFQLSVSADGLHVTPSSSRKGRSISWTKVDQVLDRFRRTGSFTPAHYRDLTFHASYLLAILRIGTGA